MISSTNKTLPPEMPPLDLNADQLNGTAEIDGRIAQVALSQLPMSTSRKCKDITVWCFRPEELGLDISGMSLEQQKNSKRVQTK